MSQIKKGAILSYINIFLNIAIGLLLTPFIICRLGDSEYGLYTLIGSFIAYLSLMDLGLNNTIIRFVSKYRAEKNKKGEEVFLGTTMKIYGIISMVLIAIGLILYFNIERIFSQSLNPEQMNSAKIMFLILVFNLAITLPGGAFTAICNAYEQFVFPRLIGIIRYILRAATVVAVLTMGGKAVSLVIVDTVFNIAVIAVTFFYVIYKQKAVFNFSDWNKLMIKQIFTYSIWIFVLGIISQLQWHSGQILLGIKTDTIAVAVYSVGILLGTYYGTFSGALSQLFLPRASQMSVHNTKEEQLDMMIKIGRICFMILMYILIGFIVLGKEFILLWVGNTYIDSWYIALIIMIGYTIPLMQTFANSLVEAYNKVSYKSKVYLVSLVSGLILGYFLMNRLQGIGVALGLTTGWIIAQIIMNVFFHNELKLNMLIFFRKVFRCQSLPILMVGIFCYYMNSLLPLNTWFIFTIKAIAISIVYWVVIFIFSMNETEKSILKIRL